MSMANNFEIVRRTDSKIVYKVPSLADITGEFIRALEWPPGIKGFIFLFSEPISEEHRILSALPLDLDVGMVYSAAKASLAATASSGDAFSEVQAPDEAELVRLYLLGRELVLAPVLSVRNVPPADRSAVQEKIKKQLAEGKIGLWSKSGVSAGALALTRWRDFADEPVQWIPWVWIASSLLPEERRDMHARIAAWLRAGVDDKVQCVVDSYNIRSQKFFRKMGFLPECLHIVKP